MRLFNFLRKKPILENSMDYVYSHPELLVDIEFANRTDRKKTVWVELACEEFEIDSNTEYRIVTHDKSFRIDFDSEDSIIFYLQYSFGFKLFKRPVSKEIRNSSDWTLVYDTSQIN